MQLIGMLDSPYVRRVAVAMLSAGVAFEHRPISLFHHIDAFSQLSPLLKAPSLIAEDGAALGRPHVAKALIGLGAFDNIDTIFRMLLTRGKPAYVPSIHITPHEAIDAIHGADGIAVLAHPGRLRTPGLIDELAERLDGLEVFYPKHDPDEVAAFRAVARRYGLAMTAGADFHDIRYHTGGVGMEVQLEDVRAFLDLAGA